MLIPISDSDLTSISYGLMTSFGFALMFFVYNYCKFNTTPKPADAETQFDAALFETVTSVPIIAGIVEHLEKWLNGPMPCATTSVPALDPKPFITRNISNPRKFVNPIQPKRTISCPAIYQGAAAFSPVSDDGDFFFADLPSPASAP